MAITLNPFVNYMTTDEHCWGLTIIGTELFISNYDTPTTIKVYDINTKALLRTLIISSSASDALGTDKTNLLIKNSSNQIVTIDKNTGGIISTKTDVIFDINVNCSSFKVDLENDRIYYGSHSTTLYIRKYSDGTLIKSYTFPIYVEGVEVIGNKYILVTCYANNQMYIAQISNNDVSNLTFSQFSPIGNTISGIIYYNKKLYCTTYSTNLISIDIIGLELQKYLIKQNSNYYTIKTTNYDSTTIYNFTPLTLTGGNTPNVSDINTFGFEDLGLLTNNMVVGSDTFSPITKFDNTAELKLYKG